MAGGVILRQEERRQHEEAVVRSFGVRAADTAQREAAEVMAARSSEVVRNQNGGRKYYGY